LKNQEELLVVHVEMGFFFGQLMKRTGSSLEAITSELTFVYANDPNPPRLYKYYIFSHPLIIFVNIFW
jgi:hypothetical protein